MYGATQIMRRHGLGTQIVNPALGPENVLRTIDQIKVVERNSFFLEEGSRKTLHREQNKEIATGNRNLLG